MTLKLINVTAEEFSYAKQLKDALSINNKILNGINVKHIIDLLKINKKSSMYQGILEIPNKLFIIKRSLKRIRQFKNFNDTPKLELNINTPTEITKTKERILQIKNALISIEEKIAPFYFKISTQNYVNIRKNYINIHDNEIKDLISQLSNLSVCIDAHEHQMQLENDKIKKLAIKKKFTYATNLSNALSINGKMLDEYNIQQIINSITINAAINHKSAKVHQGILEIPQKLKEIKSNLTKIIVTKDIGENPKIKLKIDTIEDSKKAKNKISTIYKNLLQIEETNLSKKNNKVRDLISQLFNLELCLSAHIMQMEKENIMSRPMPKVPAKQSTPKTSKPIPYYSRSSFSSISSLPSSEDILSRSMPEISANQSTSGMLEYIPYNSGSSSSSISSLKSSEYVPSFVPSSTLSPYSLWSSGSSSRSSSRSSSQSSNANDYESASESTQIISSELPSTSLKNKVKLWYAKSKKYISPNAENTKTTKDSTPETLSVSDICSTSYAEQITQKESKKTKKY